VPTEGSQSRFPVAGVRPALVSVPMSERDTGSHRPLLLEGTKVEVRTGFDDSWSSGFAVESLEGDGYRLRRRSDDQVLPVVFDPTQVRRERKNSMWWY
jgi:hypothetical protein